MKALFVFAAAFLASACFGQKITMPAQVQAIWFTDSSDRVIVECPSTVPTFDAYSIDVAKPNPIALGNYRFLACSKDGQIAAGTRFPNNDIYIIDPRNGHIRYTGLKGDAAHFAPSGHRFAAQADFMNATCSINLYDPDSMTAQTISRFAADVFAASPPDHDKVGIYLSDWTTDGIIVYQVIAHHTGMVGDRFVVDPELDRARLLPPIPRPSAAVEWIGRDSNNGQLFDGRASRSLLFSKKQAGSSLAFSPHGPYADAAKSAGVIYVAGITDDGAHAEIWVVNTLTTKARRVASGPCPMDRKPGYQTVAISPDGKWIAYRDFADPSKVDLVAVPKDVAKYK